MKVKVGRPKIILKQSNNRAAAGQIKRPVGRPRIHPILPVPPSHIPMNLRMHRQVETAPGQVTARPRPVGRPRKIHVPTESLQTIVSRRPVGRPRKIQLPSENLKHFSNNIQDYNNRRIPNTFLYKNTSVIQPFQQAYCRQRPITINAPNNGYINRPYSPNVPVMTHRYNTRSRVPVHLLYNY